MYHNTTVRQNHIHMTKIGLPPPPAASPREAPIDRHKIRTALRAIAVSCHRVALTSVRDDNASEKIRRPEGALVRER
jgi:hypothetical protein